MKIRNVARQFRRYLETYIRQNPGTEMEKAENKSYEHLRPDNRHELITQCEGLVKLRSILKAFEGPIAY